jgi:hypothetical protein
MGTVHKMIESIIQKRSNGNQAIANLTKTKLTLKGFNPSRFSPNTPDDPAVISKLKNVAIELGVTI